MTADYLEFLRLVLAFAFAKVSGVKLEYPGAPVPI